MPLTHSIRGTHDIANALRKVGVGVDDLNSQKSAVKALEHKAPPDAEGVKALREALAHLSEKDLKALRQTLGGDGEASSTSARGHSGEASARNAGVMRFDLEKHLAPKDNTPEAARVLAKYEPDLKTPVGRPFERLLGIIGTVEQVLVQESDLDKRVDLMMAKDVRRHVFLLEGAMRVYAEKLGKPAEKAGEKLEALENALGAMSLANTLLGTATEKKAPQAIIDSLTRGQAQARAALKELVSEEWSPTDKRGQVPAFNKMIKHLSEEKWGSYEKDRGYLCDQLAGHIQHMESKEYDMNNLPDGIHALRRQMRWTTVFVEATQGLVQLNADHNPLPSMKKLLEDPLATSKYVTLPPADREPNPVQLSKSLYVANMKQVLALGAIKDEGEALEFLSAEYVKTGLAPNTAEAEKMVLKLLGRTDTADALHARAKVVYQDIKASGLLPALRHEFEG